MTHSTRYATRALILLSLFAGLAGCRTTDTVSQKSSESWTDKLAFWRKSELQELQDMHEKKTQTLPPGPRADEKMAAAMMLEHQGNVDRAVTLYEEILQNDKNRIEVHHRIARLYDVQGHPEKALKHYQTALKKMPKDAELHCDFGYHYYLTADTAQAEKHLRKAIERQPSMARAHNNLGLVMAQTGRYDEALTEFRTAGNSQSAAHVNLAYALMWDEQWVDAAHQIDLAMAADPQSKVAQKALASMNAAVAAVQRREESGVMQTNYAEGTQPPTQGPVESIPVQEIMAQQYQVQ